MKSNGKRTHGKLVALVCVVSIFVGLVLATIGVSMDGLHDLRDTKIFGRSVHFGDMHSEYGYQELKKFDSIEVKGLDSADIVISCTDSDTPYAEYHYVPGVEPSFEIKDGTLTVREVATKDETSGEYDPSKYDLVIGDVYLVEEIHIYVPSGWDLKDIDVQSDYSEIGLYTLSADKVTVKTASGDLTVGGLRGESLKAELRSGNVRVEDLNLDKLQIHAESGDLETMGENNIVREKTDVTMDSGSIFMYGVFKGETKISTGSGDVDVQLLGDRDDYNCALNTDSGDAYLNNEPYKHTASAKGAKNTVEINCDSGDISLYFGAWSGDGPED